jgi:hypothetical protein
MKAGQLANNAKSHVMRAKSRYRSNKKRHRAAMSFLVDGGVRFRQLLAPKFRAIVCINVTSPSPIIA